MIPKRIKCNKCGRYFRRSYTVGIGQYYKCKKRYTNTPILLNIIERNGSLDYLKNDKRLCNTCFFSA